MATFVQVTVTNNPLHGFDVGYFSAPTFADIDGDGDLDAIVGQESNVTLKYFENTGDATTPTFTEQTGTDNPVNAVDVGFRSTPVLVDLDGDGDLDAIVGEYDGILHYFENTGNSSTPTFTEQTGTDNPFDGLDVGGNSAPILVDLDGDGDLDAIVGEYDGILNYFENTGNSSTPTFTEQTGTDNPFNTISVDAYATPSFADLDGDGDLDAVVGSDYNPLKYFENIGEATTPNFTEQTGTANPFNGLTSGTFFAPTFADLDGDGDLDAIVGEYVGNLNFLENTTSPETDVTLSSNQLSIRDINGGISPDTLVLIETSVALRIEDLNQTIQASNGVIVNNSHRVSVPINSITAPISITTLAGEDSIIANTSFALNLNAGGDNDTVRGGMGHDTIFGGEGDDSIVGGEGNDSINGGQGDDTLYGGRGGDVLDGRNDNDLILGFGNNDTINGGNGNDTVNAGGGNDMVFGTTGLDILNGSIGDDTISGGSDRDTLIGSRGNDQLIGGSDLDILNGTDNVNFGVNERDILTGGSGTQDRFKLGETTGAYYLDAGAGGTSSARILDFESLDRVILNGASSDYRIATNGGDSFILRLEPGADDTIGIIENTVGLNLAGVQFIYI